MNARHWTQLYRWVVFLPIWAAVSIAAIADDTSPAVDFNRDIRPILSDTCFTCHGPDAGTRQVDLRLDTREGLYENRGGYQVVVGGDLDNSRLFQRISAELEVARMPPPKSQRKLTPAQIDLIRRWIEQGAVWERHWAFVGPERPKRPTVRNQGWPHNEIDFFVLERLERERLAPSAAADRAGLIRRVTLDVTGLPPTPAEVEAFLRDTAPKAYERVVDRLLASPRYGERMAWRWLEAARYADTDGYQTDGERFMWRWRDWVIDAFNSNMPFDQFTVEQIAGDMLERATLEQKIATGFNRNHRGNAEGGIIPEEYRVEYVVDRVDTTSTVWLGLTTGCARCHDHKYDPIRQKEYYQLFAFFNNVPERGRSIKHGNSPPMIPAPTPSQQAVLAELEQRVRKAEQQFAAMAPTLEAAQSRWEESLSAEMPIDWTIAEGLAAKYPLDGEITYAGNELEKEEIPKASDGEPSFVASSVGEAARGVEAASFDGRRFIDCGDVGKFGYLDKFSLGAWIHSTAGEGAILSRVADTDEAEGYSLYLKAGKIRLDLSKRWLDDALRVETEDGLSPGRHHVMATYDGSRVASGVKIYLDGEPVKLRVLLDGLNQTFYINEPFRIGAVGGTKGRFHGSIEDVRVYARALDADEVAIVAHPDSITDIARTTPEKRTPAQRIKIGRYFLEQLAPEPIRQAWKNLAELRQEKVRLLESIPTTMVMKEMKHARDTFVLLRGAYDKQGEQVQAGLPAFLPPLPAGEENNRLGLARWLVDRSNPLTARVTINRFWQMYFGSGLVETVENFGSQGEPPTHPELLDWLATEFMRTGWDVKALQKTIVTSATYRQSSKVTGELRKRDPENRLLARGPRFRLSSEIVRDQTLAVSGLLVERLGGPSVRPYQPEGLWLELASAGKYKQDTGENLYRRSLYTFWKRTVPPPSMMTFDASDRETCIVRETRTNTPLQALTLMNSVTYVEASRALAERVLAGPDATPEERISAAFQFVLAREPAQAERAIIIDGFRHHRDYYRSNESEALELVSAGESPRNGMLDPGELAAYTMVASMILNLDETLTRE